jgi:F0F1-type ATP synthase assembly protein I
LKLILESSNPEKDIEAIAKSRVVRAEGSKQTYWIIGIIVVIGIGFFYRATNNLIGWGLCIAGLLAFVYYMQSLSKKQKDYKNQLLNQWREEQKQEQK